MSYLETLFNLNDKVVLVTGACGQLGNVICKGFKNSGCKVIGVDIDINENLLDGVEYFELDSRNLVEKEKLYEELLIDDNPIETMHPRIMKADEKNISDDLVIDAIDKFKTACKKQDSEQIKKLLIEYVE